MSDVTYSPEEEAILAVARIDAYNFTTLIYTCQAMSWMAQGKEWRSMKAFDIVVKIGEFLNRPEIENKTAAAPQLAEYLGTDVDRVQYVFDFQSEVYGWPLPDQIDAIQQVMPAAGHPHNDSIQFIGVLVMFTLIMTTFLGLRVYARLTINYALRAHDYVLFSAALVAFGFGVMNAACLNGPTYYRGLWDRSWNNYIVDAYSGKATETLYPVGIFLVKTSLLLFYWGLTTWRPLRVAVAITWVVVLGNSLAMIFTWVLRCNPVLSFEGYDYWTATCNIDMWLGSMDITGGINIVTDVVIWVIPLPMVWKITDGLRERLLACLTFGVGALACIACGFRFYSLHKLLEVSLIPWDQSEFLIWGMAEMYIAVICSCVPAIRALVIKMAPSFIGSTSSSSSGTESEDHFTGKDKLNSKLHIQSSSDRSSTIV